MRQHALSDIQITEALQPYGIQITEDQCTSISIYINKLQIWNAAVSLTALEDPLEIVRRHFGESLFAASLQPMSFGRLADVGSGAGFPGLALRIMHPGLTVTLLEPNLKKAAFLKEVCQTLSLSGVEIARTPYENYADTSKFDFICSRALGNYRAMLKWARTAITPEGTALLWLGVDDSILIGRTPGWNWELPVKIPESRRRVILCGRPVKFVSRETFR